ncbi:MAG: leucyl aminopeptidase family protein, partial [Deltaproteobacteria bacterium]|nr:leucyl aminopeptidase family protein [Deltaproteobacteria bacterium]
RGHGALYCNDEGFEREAVEAGRKSGNTVHALPYAPELYRREFISQVADMRNSVKDRNNAQSSCAGQFIANHIENFEGRWLHVDMAGPVWAGGRATGFGVPLLLTLAGVGAP